MGERRTGTVTVLFTDLVGSTELMVRLGALAYDDLRTAHFGALRRAVEDSGGTEIKGTGDAIHARLGAVFMAERTRIERTRAGV
jgi:class 3 adenylate cyclase